MVEYMDSARTQLEAIWRTVGVSGDALSDRHHSLLTKYRAVFDDTIAEERKYQQEIIDAIERHRASVIKISDELGQSQPTELNRRLPLLECKKKLEEDLQGLTRLTKQPCDVSDGTVPSQKQLDQLKEYVHRLECVKNARLSQYRSTKRSITNLISELETPPVSSFELDVVSGDENSFVPTADNMDHLQQYDTELQQKKELLQKRAVELRDQLKTLWSLWIDVSEDSLKISDGQQWIQTSLYTGIGSGGESLSCSSEAESQPLYRRSPDLC